MHSKKVVERPGKALLLIEIKSSEQVQPAQLCALRKIAQTLGECEAVCFSNDPHPRKIDDMMVLPWREGMRQFFLDATIA